METYATPRGWITGKKWQFRVVALGDFEGGSPSVRIGQLVVANIDGMWSFLPVPRLAKKLNSAPSAYSSVIDTTKSSYTPRPERCCGAHIHVEPLL
jgi:hypothetical protein